MDKNKSIDGLAPRRPKKTTTSSVKRTTRAKAVSATSANSTKSAATKTPIKKPVKKPIKRSTAKKSPQQSLRKDAPALAATPLAQSASAQSPSTQSTTALAPQASTDDFLKPVQAFDFDEETGNLVAAKSPTPEQSPQKGKKMKKEKKPVSKKRKIIIRVIIIILVILLAAGIGFIIWLNNKVSNMTNDGNIFDFFTETYEPLKTDQNGRTNILAFGTSGYDMAGTEGDGTHDGAQLTDSIMVISLDQETGDVAMLSLPRDLKVSTACTATAKVNEVYWCNNMEGNDDKAGAEALMAEVGDILGIDFQYYAHLNWGSLVSIVDTLGGITVTLDEDIDDSLYTGAVFQAGIPYTIDGGQALGLARARHGTASGDFTRGASQQKILIGIKDRVFEKSLSVSDLLGLVDTLGNNFSSSFSVNELKTLAHLTSNFDFNAIRQVSLIEPENYMTTGTINGISYVLPVGGAGYYTNIQKYVAKMFSSDPRKYEDSTIVVVNGTDTPGIATTEQSTLKADGYPNVDVADAPAGVTDSQYTLYALTDTAPGTQKLLEEKYHTTARPAAELPASVPATGYDFVLVLGATPDTSTNTQ